MTMRLMTRTSARVAGVVGMLLACGAAQAGPPVLDRVPENAGMVFAVQSLGRFQAAKKMLADTLQEPMTEGPLGVLDNVMAMKGLNAEGSAAVAFLPGPDGKIDFDAAQAPAVFIVPVSDYKAFVAGMGGQPAGVTEFTIDQEGGVKGFAKDLGGGYAALAETRALVEGFKGDGGHAAANDKMLGATGQAVADSADLMFICNLPVLEPNLRQGLESMQEEMKNVAAASPQEMGSAIAMLDGISTGILRDGQSAVIGMAAKESGFHVDFAAQFKEGSPTAGYFAAKGAATGLLSRLPNKPYLVAMAIDTSAPTIKKFFKAASEFAIAAQGAEANPGMMGSMLKSIDSMDGMSFEWGSVPSLMGSGFFTNTLAYIKTSKAADYTAAMQQAFTDLNGKTVQGFEYQTAYTKEAKDVAGVKVDEWSMRMIGDPNDPNAQQMQMVTMALFGPQGGPGGFIAPAEGGVVATYSKNSAMMEEGLKAAKGGEGLGADPGIKMVGAMLPADRTLEAYVGVKHILDMVSGIGIIQVQVPEDLAPIGISGSLNQGGARFAWFVPRQVVETLRQLGGPPGGDDGMDEGEQ